MTELKDDPFPRDPKLARANDVIIMRRLGIPVDDPLMQQILAAHADYQLTSILDAISAPDTVWGGRSLLSMIRDGDIDAAEHVQRYIRQVASDGFA